MEAGYIKGDSSNLPRIDSMMVANFFMSSPDFCSAEFRNVKSSMSARQSYGDDAIGYVQLRRESSICTVKCKICPEHRVRSKSYAATMVVNEELEVILSLQCHDCAASEGGCKHTVAFLMWAHRRSEEPSCTSVMCYWKKSKLARVGTTLKYITTKELSKGYPITSFTTNTEVLSNFLEEGKRRNLQNCQLMKYQPDYAIKEIEMLSMHQLIINYNEKMCDIFLESINNIFTDKVLHKIERETRNQYNNNLWHELRYGRITASKAYYVSKCKTTDGTLIAMIMGAKIPDTPAMKRGRILEDAVRNAAQKKIGKHIEKCGLLISSKYSMIAGSPDGICESAVIEIKCPTNRETYKNYVRVKNF